MDYKTFPPTADLLPLVKCYWTLEVPADFNTERQRIIPDGCIEMAFILGDDIKRFVSDTEFIIQPRAMILGQTLEPFYIQPTGYVNTFAVRFYPYGFTNFVRDPISTFANKETPIGNIFGELPCRELEEKIIQAPDTQQRIHTVEEFLIDKLNEGSTIDNIVKSTVDILMSSRGTSQINEILQGDVSRRRQLERKFMKQIGISPKQLGKVIRLQTALKMMLEQNGETLTRIAYDSEYYDQAHFIKDFKEFTGTNPGEFLGNSQTALSSLFYRGE